MSAQSKKKDTLMATVRNKTKSNHFDEQYCHAEKLKSMTALTGGIAQELDDILGTILNHTEMCLKEIKKSNPVYLHLVGIKNAGKKAENIIKQLSLFSRKTKPKPRFIKIIPIIENFLKLISVIIPVNIEIRKDLPKDCNVIFADPNHIHQIIINLSFNAAEAMEDGGTLEVSVEDAQLDDRYVLVDPNLKCGKYVKLCFIDSGKGIDTENLKRIFDPYFTTKRAGKGIGMGLAVVYGIVKSCRGFIFVNSEPGVGTSVTIYFPVAG